MRRILAVLLLPLLALAVTAGSCDSAPARGRAPAPDSVVPAYHIAPDTGDGDGGGLPLAMAPRLRMASYGTAAQLGPDSTVKLKTRVYLSGSLLASDTIRFDYLRNDSVQTSQRRRVTLDSAFVGAPPYGGTAKYSVCVQVERNGRSSGIVSSKSCWATPWSYTRPMPALANPDSIVQVAIRPAIGAVATAVALRTSTSVPTAENQAQMCAFGVTAAGRKVKLKNSWNIPACEVAYQSWLAEVPS